MPHRPHRPHHSHPPKHPQRPVQPPHHAKRPHHSHPPHHAHPPKKHSHAMTTSSPGQRPVPPLPKQQRELRKHQRLSNVVSPDTLLVDPALPRLRPKVAPTPIPGQSKRLQLQKTKPTTTPQSKIPQVKRPSRDATPNTPLATDYPAGGPDRRAFEDFNKELPDGSKMSPSVIEKTISGGEPGTWRTKRKIPATLEKMGAGKGKRPYFAYGTADKRSFEWIAGTPEHDADWGFRGNQLSPQWYTPKGDAPPGLDIYENEVHLNGSQDGLVSKVRSQPEAPNELPIDRRSLASKSPKGTDYSDPRTPPRKIQYYNPRGFDVTPFRRRVTAHVSADGQLIVRKPGEWQYWDQASKSWSNERKEPVGRKVDARTGEVVREKAPTRKASTPPEAPSPPKGGPEVPRVGPEENVFEAPPAPKGSPEPPVPAGERPPAAGAPRGDLAKGASKSWSNERKEPVGRKVDARTGEVVREKAPTRKASTPPEAPSPPKGGPEVPKGGAPIRGSIPVNIDPTPKADAIGGGAILGLEIAHTILKAFSDKREQEKARKAVAAQQPFIDKVLESGQGMTIALEYSQSSTSPTLRFVDVHVRPGSRYQRNPETQQGPGETPRFVTTYVPPDKEAAKRLRLDRDVAKVRLDELKYREKGLQRIAEERSSEKWFGRVLRGRKQNKLDREPVYAAKANLASATTAIKQGRIADAQVSMDAADKLLDQMMDNLHAYSGRSGGD
jgi:hypothetical protein